MIGRNEPCRRAEALKSRRREGEALDARELDWLAGHLGNCEACGLIEAVLNRASKNPHGSDREAPQGKDLEREIDRLMERFSRERCAPQDESERRKASKMVLWPAVAAAAAVAIVLGTLWFLRGSSSRPQKAEKAVGSVFAAPVLLLESERTHPNMLRRELPQREKIRLDRGLVVACTARGICCGAFGETELTLEEGPRGELVVALHRGKMSFAVDPAGGGALAVETADGRLTVVGTVFEVDAAPARSTRVSALRGAVEIERPGPVRKVSAGLEASMSGGDPRPISPSARERLEAFADLVALLGESDSALVEIGSAPDPLLVRLDGVDLGRTPLKAALRPGSMLLSLVDGQARVVASQRVEWKGGDHWTRFYDSADSASQTAPAQRPPAKAHAVDPARQSDKLSFEGTAAQLLAEAQQHLSRQEWREAAEAYEQIAHRWPNSELALPAWVSLGTLQLEQLGQAEAALESFERYLAHSESGALSLEAQWGKARALRALRRMDDEKRALEDLIAHSPPSALTRRAQSRLDEMVERASKAENP